MAKTWTLNPFTGKLDVTGDNTIYVPYTGATTYVDLGSNNFYTTGLIGGGRFEASGTTDQFRFGSGSTYITLHEDGTDNVTLRKFSLGSYAAGNVAFTCTGLITANSGLKSQDNITIKSGKKLIFDGGN